MNHQGRLCAELVDDLDEMIYQYRTHARTGSRVTLSRDRKEGPANVTFHKKKIMLLDTLKEAFIDARTKSLKVSALLTFCFHGGLELASYNNEPNTVSSFTIRTEEYDILVVA